MDVSIIIVNWNTRDILRDCLRSIDESAGPIRCEIIVVDNASADDSVEMVRREFPHVRLIANAENRGFATANNEGMAVAQGRYVLLLNSDTVVLDGAIARTVAQASEVDVHEVVDYGDGTIGVDYQVLLGQQIIHNNGVLTQVDGGWLIDGRTSMAPETRLDSTTASVKACGRACAAATSCGAGLTPTWWSRDGTRT